MESFIRTANVCGVASATAFQRAEPAAAHLPRMVRELLLRLRLQGGAARNRNAVQAGGGRGGVQATKRLCVQRPIGCSGGGVHRAHAAGEVNRSSVKTWSMMMNPLPNFKIQDKILQLYSIELVQSWLVARNAGQPPQNRKKHSSSACFNSEPTTNLCYRGLVVFIGTEILQ